MRNRLVSRVVATAGISGLVLAGLLSGAGGGTAGAAAATLYVSPAGKAANNGTSCATAKYSVIQTAINAAHAGDTVVVCAGTYNFANQNGQQNKPLVLVDKALTLRSESAAIDGLGPTPATGAITGITVIASHVRVEGFTVTGAVDEGILAEPPDAFAAGGSEAPKNPVAPITDVTVADNTVEHDNRGFVTPFGCTLPTEYFGDCGGGIHFNAVADSTMSANTVDNQADGILITDDAGPTHDNLITDNYVFDNTAECGITLPSHNAQAAKVTMDANGGFHVTGANPSKGGVFDNDVTDNISIGNGTAGFAGNVAGSGAGVLIAAAGPGTASYDNTIRNNVLAANGLAGVTVHSHYAGGALVSGNKILDNQIGKNNVKDDTLDAPWTVTDTVTTGILILSASPIKVEVDGNRIRHNAIGIWHNLAVTLQGGDNQFTSVGMPTFAPRGVPFGSAWCAPVNFFPQNCPAAVGGKETLHGFVDPNEISTSYYFAYGTDKNSLTSKTPTKSAGDEAGAVGALATITNLIAGKTYYFELVAKNVKGVTVTGQELSFTT